MPTRKPGFDDGNRLVTRFGGVDDMDNDVDYRFGDNNKTKYRYGGGAPAETVNVTTLTVNEASAAPTLGDKEAGYEILDTGFVNTITNEDNGAGGPTFGNPNSLTDWIDVKAYVGTYHARMTNTGGSGSLGAQSSPLNSWREIGVDTALWILESGNGSGFVDWEGLIEISDDGGSTVLDSATITLETDEV